MHDEGDDIGRGIAVFGAGDAEPGSERWDLAEATGRAIAAAGLPAVTGGYGGVMEAASRGARLAGGEAVGVTCCAFRARTPNPYLSLEIEEPDLFARTARLFRLARGFIVLGGGAGTLAELAALWAHARARVLPGPIVLLDAGWTALYRRLAQEGRLEALATGATAIAASPEQAVRLALGIPEPGREQE